MHVVQSLKKRERIQKCSGFTLVEVLFAVAFLGLMVTGIATLYFSAQQSLQAQDDILPLDSHLRGRMEEILSRPFDAVSNGSEVITVNGESYTVTWTVVLADMDADSAPEPNAKQVTVSVDGRSLSTIMVDNDGLIGKI